MAYPVTLNGRTYTLADFEGTNYVEGLPDAFEDFVTHAGDIYNSTSTTSNSIGTGSKTFTVESAKPYQAGTPLRIADAAAPSTNFMDCIVTSYSGTTLVVDAVGYAGSGTFTSWNVNIGGAASVAGTVAIAQGGTGATTAAAARTNLDVYSKADADSRFLNVSGEASDVTMTGNVTIGDAAGDTLSVPATASFSGGISGDVAFDTDTLFVDATNDRVGVGVATPDSNLHVYNGSAGSITASGSQLVVENNTTARLTFLSPSNTGGVIEFGDPDDQDVGKINYDHTNNEFRISAGAQPNMAVIGYQDIVINENSYNADFRVESNSLTHALFVDAGSNAVGINNSSPSGVKLSVHGGGTAALAWGNTSDAGLLSFDGSGNPVVRGASGLGINFQTNGSREVAFFGTSETVFNEPGNNQDFRVESDARTHMLFVDASASAVGINSSNPDGIFEIFALPSGGATSNLINFVAQDGGNQNSDSPVLHLGADGQTNGARFQAVNIDAYGKKDLVLSMNNGTDYATSAERFRFKHGGGFITNPSNGGATVFNEGGADADFRIESDTNTHALVVDAQYGSVGIKRTSPSYDLDVNASFRTVYSVPAYTSTTGTGASSDYWKLGTVTNLVGSRSLKIRILGTSSYSPGNIAGETTILFRANNAGTTTNGTFWSETSGNNHVAAVAWKQTGTNDQFDIWVKWASSFAGTDIFVETPAQWSFDVTNTGSTSQPSGSTLISARKATYTGDRLALNLESSEVSINDTSNDMDFRVESDNNTHAFYVDGGNGAKYFGTGTNQGTTGAGTFNIVVHGGDAFNLRHLVDGNHLMNLNQDGTTTYKAIHFSKNGVGKGEISVSTSGVSYNTSSDYRLKENVVDLTGATTRLNQLAPKRFNFISDPDDIVDGFLAHEVSDIVPEAITGEKDAVDGDGNPIYQSIDHSKLVPLLVATIKELEARITALESN